MKKTFSFLAAAAIAFAACSKTETGPCTDQENSNADLVPVNVQFAGAVTKAGESDPEKTINSLQVILYRVNGETKTMESYYSFNPAAMKGTIYIDPSKEAEKYLIAAYANQETLTQAKYAEDWALFSEEASGDFQMYGEWFKAKAELGDEVTIDLIRQCSKVTVNKVSLDWTNSANNYKTFKLKSMYLMDAEGVFANVHSLTSAVLSANPWLNKNGVITDMNDSFLYKAINSVEVKESTPYTTANIFYGYISDLDKYNTTATWAESGTRLVIEAEFDGAATYYAVPVNKDNMKKLRNKHFIFDNITITKPGAKSPYLALAEENDVVVTVKVADWSEVNHGTVTIR